MFSRCFGLFKNTNEQQALLPNNETECVRVARRTGLITTGLGTLITTVGAFLYILSDKNLDLHHKDDSSSYDWRATGDQLPISGFLVMTIGTLTLVTGLATVLINECKEYKRKLEQNFDKRQEENVSRVTSNL